MKINKRFLLLFAVLICNISFVNSQTKKVAILDIVDKENTLKYGHKLLLIGKLSAAITNTPGYEAYERVDMRSIIDEQHFQRTGLVDSDQIKSIGVRTGVDYILITEIAKFDDENFIITSKILNVETAKLDKSADVQTTADIKTIEKSCRTLAAKLLDREDIVKALDIIDNADIDAPFVKVERMPSFQGGDLMTFRNWVQSKVKYPQIAQENGISGRVLISFVIERNGLLTGIQVLQSPDSSLSDETVRVLKQSPRWVPGMQRNQLVRVKYTLPVDFRIQN